MPSIKVIMSDYCELESARMRPCRRTLKYAIVALGLSTKELAEIIQDATGVAVDASVALDTKAKESLQTLNISQLGAIWKRLSDHPRWSERL
jgi:hypothetical protein